jgi:hypothetical protein
LPRDARGAFIDLYATVLPLLAGGDDDACCSACFADRDYFGAKSVSKSSNSDLAVYVPSLKVKLTAGDCDFPNLSGLRYHPNVTGYHYSWERYTQLM